MDYKLINTPEEWVKLRVMTALPKYISTDEILSNSQLVVELTEIRDILFKFLEEHPTAIGISAIQLGIQSPCFAFYNGGRNKEQIFVYNPEFNYLGKKEYGSESCLSFPNMAAAKVGRYKKISLRYLTFNKSNKLVEMRGMFKDFSARVVQHEIDHLYGIEMWDRATSIPFPEGLDLTAVYKYKHDYYLDEAEKRWFYKNEPVELVEDIAIMRECVGYKFKNKEVEK